MNGQAEPRMTTDAHSLKWEQQMAAVVHGACEVLHASRCDLLEKPTATSL